MSRLLFSRHLLFPVYSFKAKYIPLLMVYFSFGAQALAAVAITFWEKEVLSLSTEEIISVSVWITIPWTAKVIIGQLVDTTPLFRSYRKSWVYLGAVLMAWGYINLYSINKEMVYITWIDSEYHQYIFAYVVVSIGYMIQDVSADAMSTEVIDRSLSDKDIKKEAAVIQVLGRLAVMIAAAITAGVGGLLAKVLSYDMVFLCALGIPLISITGVSLVQLEEVKKGSLQPIVLFSGLLFVVFIFYVSLFVSSYQQEVIFIGSLIFLVLMLSALLKNIDQQSRYRIFLGFAALFAFLASPVVGPSYMWWSIDTLEFDQVFIGLLGQVGGLVAIIVLWIASDFIAKSPIKKILLLLIICQALFQLPNIMLYYGVHDYLGISAKAFALFDSSLDTPLSHIAFIPALAFIAYHAPSGNKATWFAVSASLLNVGLTAKQLGSKYLNQIFTVSREITNEAGDIITAADYSELGGLLCVVLVLGIIMPLVFLVPCKKL